MKYFYHKKKFYRIMKINIVVVRCFFYNLDKFSDVLVHILV